MKERICKFKSIKLTETLLTERFCGGASASENNQSSLLRFRSKPFVRGYLSTAKIKIYINSFCRRDVLPLFI